MWKWLCGSVLCVGAFPWWSDKGRSQICMRLDLLYQRVSAFLGNQFHPCITHSKHVHIAVMTISRCWLCVSCLLSMNSVSTCEPRLLVYTSVISCYIIIIVSSAFFLCHGLELGHTPASVKHLVSTLSHPASVAMVTIEHPCTCCHGLSAPLSVCHPIAS
jgi:hypothetical protein